MAYGWSRWRWRRQRRKEKSRHNHPEIDANKKCAPYVFAIIIFVSILTKGEMVIREIETLILSISGAICAVCLCAYVGVCMYRISTKLISLWLWFYSKCREKKTEMKATCKKHQNRPHWYHTSSDDILKRTLNREDE